MSSTALQALPNSAFAVMMNGRGLRLTPGMDFEEWEDLGRQLGHGSNAYAWAIGDWVFYGEWEYGSRYETAVEVTGLSRQALMDLKYVAGRFEASRRRERLSISHHREVAPKPLVEQDAWLDWAEEKEASVMTLRAAIAADREAVPPAPEGGPQPAQQVLPRHEQLSLDLELAGVAERFRSERSSGLVVVSQTLANEMLDEWSPPVQVRLKETSPGLFLLEARNAA